MTTLRSFSSMLNEFLTYPLLMEETMKRSYLLENVEKNDEWKGGTLIVPFKGASASSYRYGKLVKEADISEYEYVRGEVAYYKEIYGAMRWNSKDLIEHEAVGGQSEGTVNEQSFLKIFPEQVDDFTGGMKDVLSVNLLIGAHFDRLTDDGQANGSMEVARPERYEIGQKVFVQSDTQAATFGYVKTIDINLRLLTLVTERGGSTPKDISAYLAADNTKTYFEDAFETGKAFTSLREQLLPAAQGGSSSLFGQSKLAYPYLQAIAVNGGVGGLAISATTILDGIFDAWTTVQNRGKGHATDCVMSYKNLGAVMKLLESGAGAYRHVETKASVYGYTEVVVFGVKGQLKLVGVHEMEDDVIYFLDWRAMRLNSNGYFRKQVDPEGKAYYTVRGEDGYVYICDISFYGELTCHRPSHCGVIYGVSF